MGEGRVGGIRRVVHRVRKRRRMILCSHRISIHAVARMSRSRGVMMVSRVRLRKRGAIGGIGRVHDWKLSGRKRMNEDRTWFRGAPLRRSRSLWLFARVRDERRARS